MAASTAVLTPTSLSAAGTMAMPSSFAIANSSPMSSDPSRRTTVPDLPCVLASAAPDVIPGCRSGYRLGAIHNRGLQKQQQLRVRLPWSPPQQQQQQQQQPYVHHLAFFPLGNSAKRRLCRCRSGVDPTVVAVSASSSSSESMSKPAQSVSEPASESVSGAAKVPKWKQKLEAANARAEMSRRLSQQRQEEYRLQQMQLAQRQAGAAGGNSGVVPLKDLEYQPFVTEEGRIVDCSKAGTKASVFAIFDEDKTLQYVGMSRQVYQSMRLHFARMPSTCHFVKVVHIASPSRSILEAIQTAWMEENGSRPPGNDGGETQHLWENALDCKPLMTEEEKEVVGQMEEGPKRARALKNVARRIESRLVEQFKLRNVSETLRFDPKLKEKGLLDLKSTQYVPDASVPTAAPAEKAKAA